VVGTGIWRQAQDGNGEGALTADDREARFEKLYQAMFHRILGYALRRSDSREDAADVVAETFTIAWRRLDDVPDGEPAQLWLYGVARNILANHRRGLVRRHDLSAALAAEVASRSDRRPDDGEFGAVARVFRALPDDDRELLTLVAWEGLDPGEIAKVLGISANAVRIRLHRARRRLARGLTQAGVTLGGLAFTGRSQ
jgi:RNA polymerase sigma-70 factor (ECF subfamily)